MRIASQTIILLTAVILAFNISWHVCATFDFFYPALYSSLSIEEHIQKFAPKNRNHIRRNFKETTPFEHQLLFKKIVDGIQEDGRGLKDLQFFSKRINNHINLLTRPEIVHLKDVSLLVKRFNQFSLIAAALFLSCLLCMAKLKIKPYMPFQQFRILLLSLGGIGGIVLFIGPKKVFYKAHELIFTENQWFFYYEESLMTTLMKAPDIFGYIAIIILIVSVLIIAIFTKVLYILFNRYYKQDG